MIYHCYFVVKYPEGFWKDGTKVKYYSITGDIKRLKLILDTYFKIYPFSEELKDYPVGFWGRLMKLEDFEKNPQDNKKVLIPMQASTEVLDGLLN